MKRVPAAAINKNQMYLTQVVADTCDRQLSVSTVGLSRYSPKKTIPDYFLLPNNLLRASTEIGVKTDLLSKSE